MKEKATKGKIRWDGQRLWDRKEEGKREREKERSIEEREIKERGRELKERRRWKINRERELEKEG